MPYFFHLGFELYPTQTASEKPPANIYLPPAGTDIFDSLPVHQVSAWGTSEHKRSNRKSKSAVVPLRGDHSGADAQHQGASVKDQKYIADWRFDKVSIQSIDMEVRDAQGAAGPRGKAVSDPASSSGLATKGRFVPSTPKNTELGWGVVHLYRDAKETQGLYDDSASSAASDNGQGSDEAANFNPDDCTTLCILAVPSYMTPSDLLGFVGERTREDVSHFRLIRTGRANKYMVLMKFREARRAKAWQKEWNGKLFNTMEPENCHVVFVKSIEFENGAANSNPSSYPNMSDDPFSPTVRQPSSAPVPTNSISPTDNSSRSTLSTKPLAPPTPALVELPTCPVCLERMDETTGLLTILCQHVFHCACLEKWHGSGCPVCRYTQSDALIRRGQSDMSEHDNECSVCGATANLWICLICGNIGCGRYDSAHAFAHYEATSHSYAMDIATQHVWDYAGDGYVHRLIQTKADGKLMDLPAAYSSKNHGMTGLAEDTVPREKLDNMGMEYALLLTSQLDSQRLYFQEQVERAVDKATQASAAAEKATVASDALLQQFKILQTSYTEAQTTISNLGKDISRANTRAEKAENLARKLGKDWREEKTMNEGLMQKISKLNGKVEGWESKAKEWAAEKAELEEQNRDLTFFISSSEKLKQAGADEDVVEGTIEVPVQEEGGKGRKRKGKGKK